MSGKPVYILTVDGALRNTGVILWRLVKDGVDRRWDPVKWTVITTSGAAGKLDRKSDILSENIRDIIRQLDQFLENYPPSLLGAEITPGGGKSSNAIKSLAVIQTVLVSYSWIRDIPMIGVAPEQVKLALASKRHASKVEMDQAAAALYPQIGDEYLSKTAKSGYQGSFEHVADAVGILQAIRADPAVGILEQREV